MKSYHVLGQARDQIEALRKTLKVLPKASDYSLGKLDPQYVEDVESVKGFNSGVRAQMLSVGTTAAAESVSLERQERLESDCRSYLKASLLRSGFRAVGRTCEQVMAWAAVHVEPELLSAIFAGVPTQAQFDAFYEAWRNLSLRSRQRIAKAHREKTLAEFYEAVAKSVQGD